MHRSEPLECLQDGETTQKIFPEKLWHFSSTENRNISIIRSAVETLDKASFYNTCHCGWMQMEKVVAKTHESNQYVSFFLLLA